MSARVLIIAALLAAGCTTPQASTPPPPRTDLAAACHGRDGWSDPAPAAHVAGNVWDVGTCGITVLLVTSPQGHILIDGATAAAVPSILANIRRIGFDPADVRWILSSHEHSDHAGGLAALKAATGAKLAAGAASAKVLERGQVGSDDPQSGIHEAYAPVGVDRVLANGDTVEVGDLRLTMHDTPVHSPGSASWSWQSVEGQSAGGAQTFSYIDSLTTISADGYRFTDHPGRVAEIRTGLENAAALPCGILLTPHPSASDMFERLAGRIALSRPGDCADYVAGARKRFAERLAKEAAQ